MKMRKAIQQEVGGQRIVKMERREVARMAAVQVLCQTRRLTAGR